MEGRSSQQNSKAKTGIRPIHSATKNISFNMLSVKGGCAMSAYAGGLYTSTGVILVLFILLVIVSRAFIW
jgi:hypothetical protein